MTTWRSTAVAVLVATLSACADGEVPHGERPDIVIVLVDTLRADYVQPYGFDREATPHLARLTEESVLFEAAHAPAPWTLPSVVSILSGRHVAEHGVIHPGVKLSAEIPILSEILRGEGYRTASHHRNGWAGVKSGLERGFEQCVLVDQSVDGAYLRPFYDVIQALGAEDPYFLYVHNTEPHDPQNTTEPHLSAFEPVPKEFIEEYARLVSDYRVLSRVNRDPDEPDDSDEQAAKMRALTARVDEVRNLYSCSVREADERIGSIVAEIQARGRWDRTVFIVLSDHGEEMSDHGGWQHDQSLYQELVHVPLLIKLPDAAHAGHRVSTPISLVDVLPTLLELVGATPPDDLSGRDLLPLLEKEPEPEPTLVSIRHNTHKFYRPYDEARGDLNVAVRFGDWKGILNVERDGFELYELGADPREQRDLAAERPDLAANLRGFAAESYADLLRAAVPPEEARIENASREVLRSLRDLGYIGDDD